MNPFPIVVSLVGFLVGIAAGGALGYWARNRMAQSEAKEFQIKLEKTQVDVDARAKELELQARDEIDQRRKAFEEEVNSRRKELGQQERRLEKRRDELDARFERLESREQQASKRQSQLDKRNNELKAREDQQIAELERIAELTCEEAREELLATVETTTRNDMARIIRKIEDEARHEGENRARKIVTVALQRVATEDVAEHAISVVPIVSDDMKGRIIGRAGRNIRAFELATGVDVVVDDTPEAVMISSFDPVRREVAKRALIKLINDGRIHPAHIEKVVKDTRKDVEAIIKEKGEQAAYEAGVAGLHPELLRLLGRLYFRTSYGQNQNRHAVETALIAASIAAELGADVNIAKAGGLLHDLGKAIDHEVEGTHAAIGAEMAKRYGVSPVICNAVAAHHHEVEQETIEAVIVEVADAISGSRPGARRESMEEYIKRIKALEDIGRSFKGVEECYALQAGREVRIIVRPEKIDDKGAIELSKNVARQIEENMQYPGQIRVTVIRETRSTDYAK